jgi:hypothetical protein
MLRDVASLPLPIPWMALMDTSRIRVRVAAVRTPAATL